MNLLSSLLKYTADQIAALRAKNTSQDDTVSGINTRLGTAETKVTNMEAQLATAISAVTVDSEVQNIRVGDDNVTYTSAGEAVRTQFSNVKSALTDKLYISNVLRGTITSTTGLPSGSTTRLRTAKKIGKRDHIYSVKADTGYAVSIFAYASDNDADYVGVYSTTDNTFAKTYVDRNLVLDGFDFSKYPEYVFYVTIMNTDSTEITVDKYNKVSYVANDLISEVDKLDEAIETIDDVNANNEFLFDNYTEPFTEEALIFIQTDNLYDGIYDEGMWLNEVGELVATTGYSTTDFIPVQGGQKVYLSRKLGEEYGQTRTPANAARYAVYDKYKNFISGNTSYWQNNITIPSNAYYLKVSCTSSFLTTTELEVSYRYANLSGTTKADNNRVPNKAKATYRITNLLNDTVSAFASEWSAQGGSVSASDEELCINLVGNGTAQYPVLYNNVAVPYKKGHTYYVQVSVRTSNDKCSILAMQPMYSVLNQAKTIGEVQKDNWYTYSWFITPTSDGTSCAIPLRLYGYFASASDETGTVISVRRPVIIDTEDFKRNVKLYQIDRFLSNYGYIHRTAYVDFDEYLKENNYLLDERKCYQVPQRKAMATFVADDGYQNDFRKMHILSEKYGVPMCQAVASGMSGALISVTEMLYAQNYLGWEFASHTYNHIDLSTLTESQIENQCVLSKDALESEGIKCTSIVYPYGGGNALARMVCKKYFELGATTVNGQNEGVVPSFYLKRRPLGSFYSSGTWEEYKGYVDEAIANDAWLIFMLHPNNADHDTTQQELFEQTIQYLIENDVPIVTLHDGYQYFGNAFEVGDYIGEGTGIAISMTGEKDGI